MSASQRLIKRLEDDLAEQKVSRWTRATYVRTYLQFSLIGAIGLTGREEGSYHCLCRAVSSLCVKEREEEDLWPEVLCCVYVRTSLGGHDCSVYPHTPLPISFQSLLVSERSRAKDLQLQLVEKSSSAGEVSSTLRVLQDQLGEMEGRVETLKAEKAALSHELAAKEAAVGRLQRLTEELKSRSEEEKGFLARQREEEVARVKERLSQLEEELSGKNREVIDSATKMAKMVSGMCVYEWMVVEQ